MGQAVPAEEEMQVIVQQQIQEEVAAEDEWGEGGKATARDMCVAVVWSKVLVRAQVPS
jgi:hypothetical protein